MPVLLVTVVFVLLGTWVPAALRGAEPVLVPGLILLLGLPHGATDHGLFQALTHSQGGKQSPWFYLVYLGAIAAYGLLWYLFPLLAFGIFIVLSVYHFGQSNWVSVRYGSQLAARLHYLLWGTAILLTPILLHAEEAIDIVAAMTGSSLPNPASNAIHWFIGGMAVLNVGAVVTLHAKGMITSRRVGYELLSYALLMVLFFTTSLLLGFTVYFVFWHSLSSAHDQFRFFRRHLSPSLRRKLGAHIGSTVLGALLFCLFVWFGPGPAAVLQPAFIGGLFIAISLLTLPHMLLVEQLYRVWSPLDPAPSLPRPTAPRTIREGLPVTN